MDYEKIFLRELISVPVLCKENLKLYTATSLQYLNCYPRIPFLSFLLGKEAASHRFDSKKFHLPFICYSNYSQKILRWAMKKSIVKVYSSVFERNEILLH